MSPRRKIVFLSMLFVVTNGTIACEDIGEKSGFVEGDDLPNERASQAASPSGLKGNYYNNSNFTAQVFERVDSTIDFAWGRGSPDSRIDPDTFSIRWTGFVTPSTSETYTFYTVSDDGVRLYVDEKLLINNWTVHSPTENSATISLQAGKSYAIKLEYFENRGGAVAKLIWSSPSQGKQIIPAARLSQVPAGEVFKLELKTDNYPEDTSWQLVDKDTSAVVASGPSNGPYSKNAVHTVEKILPNGSYAFTIKDSVGDGICCRYGHGYFKVFLDGQELFSEGRVFKTATYPIQVGPRAPMTTREEQWLDAHNDYRSAYDPDGDQPTFVPLKWSPALAAEAQAWAESLLTTGLPVTDSNGNTVVKTACNSNVSLRRRTPSELHDHSTKHGENITLRIGSGDWGKDRTPPVLVGGPWARSPSHNAQMVWRGTHYIGCGSAALVPDLDFTGFNCRIYVCRFARTGNCAGHSWKDDYTPCGPSPCPPDGCYSHKD
jgi:hypothetical protein